MVWDKHNNLLRGVQQGEIFSPLHGQCINHDHIKTQGDNLL
jgi:hypothetical protein